MFPSIFKTFALSAVCLNLLSQPLHAQGVPSEKRLPPGVLLHFSIPNFPELGMKMKDTSMGAMINDPAFDDFRVQLMDKFQEMSAKTEEELGFPLSDLEALLAGEMSISVVRPIGQSLGLVSTLFIGDHKDVLDQLLVKIDEELQTKNAVKETEDFADTEITFYSIPNPNAKPNAPPMTVAYFLKDETFVAASSISILESVLARWDGEHDETFADSKVYNAIQAKCTSNERSKPVIKWYVNPVDLTLAAMSMSPQTQMPAAMAGAYLPTLGLNKLKAFGGAVEMATDEFDSISRTMIYVDTPAGGLLKLFDFPSTIDGPPNWVPAESGSYFGFHWNLLAAYNAVESMYDSFMGQPGGFERMVVNAAKRADGPDLNPKEDVIDVLSGVFHGYMAAGKAEDKTPVIGVLSFGVNDEQKALKLLKAIGNDKEFQTKDAQGITIYENETGVAAIHQGVVYLASSQKQLEDALFNKNESLGKSAGFQSVTQKLPAKTSILTYAGNAGQWEASYNNLRDGKFDSFTEGEFDFSVLPPFATVGKYLMPSTSYTVQDEKGCVITQFTNKRE